MMSRIAAKKFVFSFATFVALALSLFVSVPVYAQVTGATLTGTVTDASGAVIPDAKISVTDVATGTNRTTTTGTAGFYTVPNLDPATYQVTASAPGFSTLVRSGITLTVGSQQVLNLSLQVGEVTQQVEVVTEAPTVELASSSLSMEVNATTMREMPLNGRDWTQLATFQPGVTSLGSQQAADSGSLGASSARGTRGFGVELSISGGNMQQNNYRVDGISVIDYANSSPGNVLNAATGVDAIQEFSVVTSNYSAEYGRTSGGVINAITRSGTNQLHGDVYDFLRNSALDARNFYDSSQIPEFRKNQFGGSAGLPIRKDKTFIFGDYEGVRQSLGVTRNSNVPSPDLRNGIIHNADGTTTTVPVDPNVALYMGLLPLPTPGIPLLAPGNSGTFRFVVQSPATENYVSTRFDEHFSEKDSVFASATWDRSHLTLPDPLDVVLLQQYVDNVRVAIEESHTFSSSFVNNVRGGWNSINAQPGGGIAAINPLAIDPRLSAIPGADTAGDSVSGISGASGVNNQAYARYFWDSGQIYDDAFIMKGKQSIKFGFGIERDYSNMYNHPGSTGGGFTSPSLSAWLQNLPSKFSGGLPGTNPWVHSRQNIIGAYVQDDIRWKPNLTFNLGLRYEMAMNPTERDNHYASIPSVPSAALHIGAPLYSNPTLRNFEPRIGFAWDPFGSGKTSVRGGFGIFDVLPLIWEYNITEASTEPFSETASVNFTAAQSATHPYPKGALPIIAAIPLLRVAQIEQNPHRNYVMQWNLSMQREVLPGLTVMAAYLGMHGVHILQRGDDSNMVYPTLTSAGFLWPASGGITVNPKFGRIDGTQWGGESFYDGLQMQVTKRMSHGLQVQGAFTWSKTVDTGDFGNIADIYGNSITNVFIFEPKFNRTVADFNVKENLVVNATWALPNPKLSSQVANRALGGWQLGGILTARTGLPFSVNISGDPLNTLSSSATDYPNYSPGCNVVNGNFKSITHAGLPVYINVNCFSLPMATPAIAAQCNTFKPGGVAAVGTCSNLQGNTGRNQFLGPGLIDLDFSVFKNNYFGPLERFNAQFRVETFNIFNHANFNYPTSVSLFDQTGAPVAGAGSIATTSTTSRQIQLALKLIW